MSVDVMIVGTPRSGTSTLLVHLGRHPRLQAQRLPELTWFGDPKQRSGPFPERRFFDGDRDGRLRVGKAAGMMFDPSAIARLRELNPAVQVAVMVREPAARAHSSFWWARRQGLEQVRDFAEVWEIVKRDGTAAGRRHHLFEGGRYGTHVGALFDTCGRDAVEVIVLEEYRADPHRVLQPLAAKLGIDPEGFPAEVPVENAASTRSGGPSRPGSVRDRVRAVYRRSNQRDVQPTDLDPSIAAELRAHYVDEVRRLEELLGRPIDAWR